MRKTLRRSCDACAKSKLSCDLRSPQCSRCIKRKTACVYANQPLTSPPLQSTAVATQSSPNNAEDATVMHLTSSMTNVRSPGNQSFDPFDSYPRTRLPRAHVQRLIQHFLSNIAFQYYPLDLNAASNPFVVSWWPLALADPALFHVSLQTASLDIDLRAQKGFKSSEILMADSVSLVRHRIENPVLASRDETMDSVVTLAAIEFGKGNTSIGTMHIDGVKRMVQMRGGMRQLKLTSPLTARMVSWVSMIVMQSPQFSTQEDSGVGLGIAPIPQWRDADPDLRDLGLSRLDGLNLDPAISDILFRLRSLFHNPERNNLTSTDLHDLTCFVLHRLLSWSPQQVYAHIPQAQMVSAGIRHAVALYLLINHGPTYFSHAHLQYELILELKASIGHSLDFLCLSHPTLALWLLSVGLVASNGTPDYHWFVNQARIVAKSEDIHTWEDMLGRLKEILWYPKLQTEHFFHHRWEEILAITAHDQPSRQ
ncbi:hypothetical protein BKA66DRAFT_427048 [Pyrenochaeta sp. MPI-SDFR-AT-0127]|nr:hypothetical protein BKA66DRAFT_427048 [Pyrenochaeta sp. MPI-SDFR-AT-0127]